MTITTGSMRQLGFEDKPVLRFGEEEKAPGAWAGRRLLWLNERPAFQLSHWCGTCQFLFKRLEGANETCSLDQAQDALAAGLTDLNDDVIELFAGLLPKGDYLPMLLTIEPRLVTPSREGDYFAEEQVATWNVEAFWGLPEYPQTPYYRTFETPVDDGAHLFEFVVPMVPPTWNDRARVGSYIAALEASSLPTAVAVSTLDVCQPATDQGGDDHFVHWGLTHFLLDGHHKLEAAARSGRPMQLLTLLTADASLALGDQVARVPQLRSGIRAGRPARGSN